MKGRYQLRHPQYGVGYKYTKLENARTELSKCVGGNWFIYDRLTKQEVR